MPDFPLAALRSVEITTPDLERSIEFYTRVWGLDVAAQQDGKAFLSATGSDFHVLELKAARAVSLRKVTFRARSRNDLVTMEAKLLASGCMPVRRTGMADAPSGGERFIIREPQGCLIEFVHGDATKQARFVPGKPFRLAHVNINSNDIESLTDFYRGALGFRLTDRSKTMAFLCCNSDHHAVVLAEAPVNGLNHIAFLMPDLESVMRASGNVKQAGYPIGWGVGRHGPGDNVFAYFVDPTGVVIEYTAEVLQVDDQYSFRGPDEWVWPAGRVDHWGIAPPKSDACKVAQIAVPFASPGIQQKIDVS